MVTHVSDFGSNVNENLENWGKALGRSQARRAIFNLIYGKQKKRWTSDEIMEATGLGRVTALHEGKKLAANGLLHEVRESGRVIYEKDSRVQHRKKAIIKYADSTVARNALPTKRRPATIKLSTVRVRTDRARAKLITIDDIDSFGKAHGVEVSRFLGDEVRESQFRDGIREILGELGHFADWGGEQHDLFSSKVRMAGKRHTAAFAFKGPGTKGVLTPGRCGKNGDQIQRLLESPATVFFFQYNRQISPSVVSQMKAYAALHSIHSRQEVFYGVIDGEDSLRLVRAYASAFKYKAPKAR